MKRRAPIFRITAALLLSTLIALPTAAQDSPTREEQAAAGMLVEDYRFGDFGSARGIAVDQFGRVFVTDAGRSTVSRFTMNGTREFEIGGPGWSNTQLYEPRGIDASLGIAVYVADRDNHRVVRYDGNLNVQSTFSTLDDPSQDVQFGYPLDVVSSEFEDLYILDGENQRVLTTRGLGGVVNVFGGVESGAGRLQDPVAMALGGKGMLYVLEQTRVVTFDNFGSFRGSFGNDMFEEATGIACSADLVLVVTPDALHFFNAEGVALAVQTREALTLAHPCGEFRDAAFQRNGILLLSEESVIILRQTN